ncbi:Vacuolar fusion protein mon1 [Pleurotus pulmonarius]|nr:Vacuolar fusion protein mon1 [Pleurotus pulmonarius]
MHTPRSRTPSRASTPAFTRPGSSRIVIPTLRHASSKATLTPTTVSNDNSPPSRQVLDSAASSVLDLDMTEGILLQEAETDADAAEGEEVNVMGSLNTTAGHEDSKQSLRDQLRKTLNRKQSMQDLPSPRTKVKPAMDDIPYEPTQSFSEREYFVLTDAGKPVFVSRSGGEDSLASVIGIMQALVSVFIDDGDKLRCINTKTSRITFLIRSPLYYVCYSNWGEPESVTRSHLEYLHLQIISIVTASHLRKLFERRGNFDLRRLLDGAESFLTSILERLQSDVAMNTSSLLCLKLDPSLRKRAADCLIPTSKMKDVLYVFLVANGRVVTLIRPKKHSIHPADIHTLLNTIYNPSILHSPASTSCIPICLPKFNPSGFMNAYISFLRKPEGVSTSTDAPKSTTPSDCDDSTLALVCLNGVGEFDTIKGWCESVSQKLDNEGISDAIISDLRNGKTEYSVAELGIPGLRHFVYKSRGQVQVTIPSFDDPYDSPTERRRLLTLYQILHDAIHAKSGQGGMLKLQYIKTEKESVLGWITQPFELYITLSPMLPKSAAVGAANSVVRWTRLRAIVSFLNVTITVTTPIGEAINLVLGHTIGMLPYLLSSDWPVGQLYELPSLLLFAFPTPSPTPSFPFAMSKQLLDTPAKHPFSVTGLADRAWNRIREAAFNTGWAPMTRFAEMAVVSLMERITVGELRVLTLSNVYEFRDPHSDSQSPLKAELRVVNDVFWVRLCTMGDLGFAEAYMYGDVECDDLVSLFMIFLENRENLSNLDSRLSYLFTLPQRLTSHRFLNTIGNSRSNISAHYDISNDMFTGFLSEDLTYSCGIFEDLDGDHRKFGNQTQWSGGQGLKRIQQSERVNRDDGNGTATINGKDELYDAQIRKLRHIFEKARILPGHRVLEIGSGWGSMAMFIARNSPTTTVDTITLSIQQQELAMERIKEAGLDDRIRVHLMDYRNMPPEWEGSFDRVISVEMIEAVGFEFLEKYWSVVDWALKRKGGVGVVQVITIPEAIFPGGILPTLSLLFQTMEKGSGGRLIVDSVSNIGPHYALPALKKEYPDVMTGRNGRFPDELASSSCYCEAGFTSRTLGGMKIITKSLHILLVNELGYISHFEEANTQASVDLRSQHRQADVTELQPGSNFLPTFYDLHLHAPQFLYQGVGLHLPLMQWLDDYAYKAEERLDSDPTLAGEVYDELATHLIANGSGAALLFGTIKSETNIILARAMQNAGIRGFIGKLSMDISSRATYVEASAEASLSSIASFIDECTDLVKDLPSHEHFVEPVITPRFIPTCSDALLRGLGHLAAQKGVRVQSHLAESLDEVEWVKQERGQDDIDIFEKHGLLTPRTVHAHCTFLPTPSLKRLATRGTSIAHCPLSNAYFSAQPFRLWESIQQGVKVGLGTDIAGGYSLDMMNAMRHAVTVSKMREGSRILSRLGDDTTDSRLDIDWKMALYLATTGGAIALGMPPGWGTFQVGAPFDAQQIQVLDCVGQTGIGAITVFDWGDLPSGGLTMEILEKWWCLGDYRNRVAVWTQGVKRS